MGQRVVNWKSYLFALIFVIPFVWIGIAHRNKDRRDIETHRQVTCGTIIRHERAGHSGTVTYYEYFVEGKRYVAVSGDDKRFGDCIETHSCIGMKFTVEYSSVDPATSRIIWSKPDCPPDSASL
jgi:hypothetical protein